MLRAFSLVALLPSQTWPVYEPTFLLASWINFRLQFSLFSFTCLLLPHLPSPLYSFFLSLSSGIPHFFSSLFVYSLLFLYFALFCI